jgi:sugar phosphate isomerase/epimerase
MRLAVSSWSFGNLLRAGQMALADVPLAAAALGFDAVELNDYLFVPPRPGALARLFGKRAAPVPAAPDYRPATLGPVRRALLRAGTDVVALAVTSAVGGPMAEAPVQRELAGSGLAAARALGAPLMRLATGGPVDPTEPYLAEVAKRLKTLAAVARLFHVRLALENDFGLTTDPAALERLVQLTGGKDVVGVCLDLGNFRDGEGPDGIRRLAPYTTHVHAKARTFGPDGEETTIDYSAALGALRAAGYDGALSVEYGGEGDPHAGVRQTKALIERYWK